MHKRCVHGGGTVASAKEGESPIFLSDDQRTEVTNWWLKVRRRANTPNWDIVCSCRFDGQKKGLLLVEAKAHEGELNVMTDDCGANEPANRTQIRSAILEANSALNADSTTRLSGWSLSLTKCYQLSNRFAWAWKVASLGVPVILVYLGFENTVEMNEGKRTILTSGKQWHQSVLDRSKGIVPPEVWNQKLMIGGTPFMVLTRAVDVNIGVSAGGTIL